MRFNRRGDNYIDNFRPVSAIEADSDSANVESEKKQIQHYKLQYEALKTKMKSFPETKFLVWTGANHVKANISEENALRMKEWTNWVKNAEEKPYMEEPTLEMLTKDYGLIIFKHCYPAPCVRIVVASNF
ncbi:MAG TPA: hypothetical protein VJ280_03145, partial [Dehalococcoidales bacterium]|nr:hypothetical protein [Dehalococcoidales bacterium]